MIHYVCKYTPIELFSGFGETAVPLQDMPDNFDLADTIAHANLCGFGRSVIQNVLEGKVTELVLVNCCDSMRRVYDIVRSSGKLKFAYLLDLPHEDISCAKQSFTEAVIRLKDAYADYSGKSFDLNAFLASFDRNENKAADYIGLMGVRVSPALQKIIEDSTHMSVNNMTCLGSRDLPLDTKAMQDADEQTLMHCYAEILLQQIPCARMSFNARRHSLYLDPHLKGIIYHTIKFCDFYGFEYAQIKQQVQIPLLKIETDYTAQSMGQLVTRIEAFSETVEGLDRSVPDKEVRKMPETGDFYVAGIDSGSTSTDVVIMDRNKAIISSIIIPTGAGAAISADKALEMALEKSGIRRDQILHIITTGYGRAYIDSGDESITEITCHAKGAHHLNPKVRTIIDIGGQDSKAIRIDADGAVQNFLMNDKCAAGTGRFLDMMSKTLGISLEEMSTAGLSWKEAIEISSMCTVFAESEVVSLVAQNKALPDIIHGLNRSVASKVGALASRLGKEGDYMMTGGVARNAGIVKALEEKIGEPIYICDEAQLCGAIGAALFALEAVSPSQA